MTYNLTPRGPFETAQQASDAVAPFHAAVRAVGRDGTDEQMRAAMRGAAVQYVTDRLTAAGVSLGAYDKRMIQWIGATWDHEETTVVLDWVLRAHQGAAPAEVEDEAPVNSWVLYRPQPGSEILEPAGVDGDVSPALDPAELAVEKLIEYATGAWDHMVKVYGTRGQLAAWAQWENGEAVSYRNEPTVEPVHALPSIDFPGRVAGVEPGPRCGAQRGRTALFAADVTCPRCRALLDAEGTR
jgi:hypothetical protein